MFQVGESCHIRELARGILVFSLGRNSVPLPSREISQINHSFIQVWGSFLEYPSLFRILL